MDTTHFWFADKIETTRITKGRHDFVEQGLKVNIKVEGLKQDTTVIHKGTLQWSINYQYGKIDIIDLDYRFIPTPEVKLLSPQAYFKKVQHGYYVADNKTLVFHLDQVITKNRVDINSL